MAGFMGLFTKHKETGQYEPIEGVDVAGGEQQGTAPAVGQPLKAAGQPPEVKAALDEAAKLRDELATERKARAADAEARATADRKVKVDGIHAAAKAYAAGLDDKITPACAGPLARVHAALSLASAGLPALDDKGAPIDAKADLESFFAALPGHGLMAGSIASSAGGNLKPMANGATGPDDDARARKVNDEFFARMGAARDPAPTY